MLPATPCLFATSDVDKNTAKRNHPPQAHFSVTANINGLVSSVIAVDSGTYFKSTWESELWADVIVSMQFGNQRIQTSLPIELHSEYSRSRPWIGQGTFSRGVNLRRLREKERERGRAKNIAEGFVRGRRSSGGGPIISPSFSGDHQVRHMKVEQGKGKSGDAKT